MKLTSTKGRSLEINIEKGTVILTERLAYLPSGHIKRKWMDWHGATVERVCLSVDELRRALAATEER